MYLLEMWITPITRDGGACSRIILWPATIAWSGQGNRLNQSTTRQKIEDFPRYKGGPIGIPGEDFTWARRDGIRGREEKEGSIDQVNCCKVSKDRLC